MELTINNLSFGYTSKHKVLDNVSFSASSGKNIYILGPNGAGKSTLVANVLQFVKPQSGTVEVDGKNLRDIKNKDKAKLIGYVPQDVGFPSMTAFDAVLLGRKPYIKWDARKNDLEIVQNIFNELNIGDFSLRDVSKLSGGEKQKIAIARALAQETSILLFDEPTSNLDIKNQIEVLSFLQRLTKEKNLITISIVHDISLAFTFADEILLLKDGKVIKYGDVESITGDDIKQTFDIDVNIAEINNKKIIIYGD